MKELRIIADELALCLRTLVDLTPEQLKEQGLDDQYDHGALSRHFDALAEHQKFADANPAPTFADISVKTMHGYGRAYVCIDHSAGSMDLQIKPGQSTRESLLAAAAEIREDVNRRLRRAALLEAAAETIQVR